VGRITSLTQKGQITIPQEVREELGLKPHDKIEVWVESGEARLRKATRRTLREVAGSLPTPDMPVEETIARAREKRAEERARKIAADLAISE
jgi:AbrB family looped-hinge helix DNA binding protein